MPKGKKKPYPDPASYVPIVPAIKTGTVTPPPGPERPADPPPKPGPEAHARASAAAAAGAKPGEKKPDAAKPGEQKPGDPPLGQTPEQAAGALVMMTEIGTSLACKFYAARLKVKMTPELVAALALTEAERANLMTYAPYAAPFLWEVLAKYGKYIGAALYGMCFYDLVLTRFAALKDIAPPKEDVKKRKAKPEVVADTPSKEGDDAKRPTDFKVTK